MDRKTVRPARHNNMETFLTKVIVVDGLSSLTHKREISFYTVGGEEIFNVCEKDSQWHKVESFFIEEPRRLREN